MAPRTDSGLTTSTARYPYHRTIRRIGSIVAVALLAAACSGADDDATTNAPDATNAPLPTPPPTTRRPQTGDLAMNSIVIVDTEPDSPEVQAMLDDFRTHFSAFLELGRHPDDPDVAAAIHATVTGEMQTRVDQTLTVLAERNEVAIPNPDVPSSIIVDTGSITLLDDGASFDACLIDGETLVARDDPDPNIWEPTSRRVTYELTKVGEVWLVASLQFFTAFERQVGCE